MVKRGRRPQQKQFKPAYVGMRFSVAGGMLSEPVVVKVEGPQNQYVHIKKKAGWLCLMTTGSTYSMAPLHRTRLIEIFEKELNQGPDEAAVVRDDKNEALAQIVSVCGGSGMGCNRTQKAVMPVSEVSASRRWWSCTDGTDSKKLR